MKMIRCKKWCGIWFTPGEYYGRVKNNIFTSLGTKVQIGKLAECLHGVKYILPPSELGSGCKLGKISINKYTFVLADWNDI